MSPKNAAGIGKSNGFVFVVDTMAAPSLTKSKIKDKLKAYKKRYKKIVNYLITTDIHMCFYHIKHCYQKPISGTITCQKDIFLLFQIVEEITISG